MTELERELKNCVTREHEITADVLKYLREMDRTKIYLERGYSSLFGYCVGEKLYSESEAQVRISCARLTRALPNVADRLARGTLSLSVGALVYGACRRNKLSREEGAALVRQLAGCTKREALRKLAEKFPGRVRPERKRFVDGEHTEVRFTLTAEETALVEKALDLRAHTNYRRSYKELLLGLVKKEIKKREGKPTQDAPPHGPAHARGRHIPAALRRFVWRRDGGKCQICGTTHGVQLDHIHPYGAGGAHTAENLRLLCGAHNRARSC